MSRGIDTSQAIVPRRPRRRLATSTTATSTGFGHRLREIRQSRGLNQSQVGFGRYSASYVSLLERGLRRPNPEVVQFLSDNLGVEPEHFLEPVAGPPVDDDGQELAVLDVASRTAWLARDHELAAELAQEAAAVSQRAGRPESWWSFAHLRAMSLLVLERYEECHDLAVMLSRHPVAARSPELAVEALNLAARSARASGRLPQALACATEAQERAAALPRSSLQRLQCLLETVAVLADLGRLDEAVVVARSVQELRDEVESAQARGMAAWVLGSLASLNGHREEGVAEHDLARQLLTPMADLRLWGRFHKATAAMRVAQGDRDVAGLIEVADQALRFAGNESDLRELELVKAELALNEGAPERALALVDAADDPSLPPNTRAEAATLRYRALTSLGRADEAHAAITRAALLFEEAGAFQRALDAWRTNAGVDRPG